MTQHRKLNAETEALISRYRQTIPAIIPGNEKPDSVPISENRFTLSIDETAARLGISSKQVSRLIRGGELDQKKAGRRVLIPVASIETWLKRKD